MKKYYRMSDTGYVSSITTNEAGAILRVWHPGKHRNVSTKHSSFKAARKALSRWGAATLINV